MTIREFQEEYGVTQLHLEKNGISFYLSKKYRDTPVNELPEKVKVPLIALFTRYGVQV